MALSRKEKRREQRALKKRKRSPIDHAKGEGFENLPHQSENQTATRDDRVTAKGERKKAKGSNKNAKKSPKPTKSSNTSRPKPALNDEYGGMGSDLAAAMRRDEEEIAFLSAKLGLSSKKDKRKLNKEYAKEEGYGEDFGDFLDSLDTMVDHVQNQDTSDNYIPVLGGVDSAGSASSESVDEIDNGSTSSDTSEEVIPMKGPMEPPIGRGDSDATDSESDSDTSMKYMDETSSLGDAIAGSELPDHEESLTYRPDEGENIYGKRIEETEFDVKPSAYVPPHLRGKTTSQPGQTAPNESKEMGNARRLINSSLNRLSIETVISVSQKLTGLFGDYSTADMNVAIADNLRNACVSRAQIMAGLVPVYVASLVGVHVQIGDKAQLGEHLIEHFVLELVDCLTRLRTQPKEETEDSTDSALVDKEACNLLLIICYMYNFGVVHCSLMYDLIRDMIDSFKEEDAELLLVILTHSGRTLRNDDPLALKDIVLQVQQRYVQAKKATSECSRMDYMVTALMDLKNNKKRKHDTALEEKTSKLRKTLGRIKSQVASSKGGFKVADSCQRIGLSDLRNIAAKGRWWKVGASWSGNMHGEQSDPNENDSELGAEDPMQDEKLLKLAAKHRMNSDTRRSIFCIIMSSTDFEECFEKLVRGGFLSNRTERDVARVLMECCGNEKTYNKYYSLLAARVCEYQSSCKFTFQLAFFDTFKQFDSMSARKTANLSRLLFDLIVDHRVLRLNVLKAIDLSTPEDLSDNAMVFTAMLLTSILEKCADASATTQFFQMNINRRKVKVSDDISADADELGQTDEGAALMANLTVFFVQVLKSSPKYKKGSKFRSNLKAAIKACDTDNYI